MDEELEKKIVSAFVSRRIRKRMLFELFSKRRRHAISRLDDRYLETLCSEFMIEIPRPNSDPEEIEKILRKHGAGDWCYSISWKEGIDGKVLPLGTALSIAVGSGFSSIVSCIPGKLAYFESEQGFGPPPRYLLKRT
jgi:hypothetical protein